MGSAEELNIMFVDYMVLIAKLIANMLHSSDLEISSVLGGLGFGSISVAVECYMNKSSISTR